MTTTSLSCPWQTTGHVPISFRARALPPPPNPIEARTTDRACVRAPAPVHAGPHRVSERRPGVPQPRSPPRSRPAPTCPNQPARDFRSRDPPRTFCSRAHAKLIFCFVWVYTPFPLVFMYHSCFQGGRVQSQNSCLRGNIGVNTT